MTQDTIGWKLKELDRILNDPMSPMEAHRVWSLLDDVSASFGPEDDGSTTGSEQTPGGP